MMTLLIYEIYALVSILYLRHYCQSFFFVRLYTPEIFGELLRIYLPIISLIIHLSYSRLLSIISIMHQQHGKCPEWIDLARSLCVNCYQYFLLCIQCTDYLTGVDWSYLASRSDFNEEMLFFIWWLEDGKSGDPACGGEWILIYDVSIDVATLNLTTILPSFSDFKFRISYDDIDVVSVHPRSVLSVPVVNASRTVH